MCNDVLRSYIKEAKLDVIIYVYVEGSGLEQRVHAATVQLVYVHVEWDIL